VLPEMVSAETRLSPGIHADAGAVDACALTTLFGHDVIGFNGPPARNRNRKGDKMPRVVITAEVENMEKWEKGFRTHGDLFRQMGVSRMEFATGPGNRIAVSGETNNLDAYMKIYDSPATADAMAFDGIKRETVQMFVLDKELKM
jgi:hypothetical protein